VVKAKRRIIGATVTGLLVAGCATAGPVQAATTPPATTGTTTVYAGDDAYVSSLRTKVNFGAADKLVVGRQGGETRVSYLKFVTGALPAAATVTSARLTLPLESKPPTAKLSVHPAVVGWTEGKVTAATAPAIATVAAASITPRPTDLAVTLDVSEAVKKAGTYGFALKSAATTAVTRFRSAEYAKTGGPKLTVTYTTKAAATAAVCVTNAQLVPSCGVLWGAAAGGFTDVPGDQALKQWEAVTGRTATIFHAYHKGNERFPTKAEIAMTRDPAHPRVLLLNWKVAYGSTWAKVAAGQQDARIDAWAAYVKATYAQKFYLALHHEPENDVIPAAGSGMTAKDYAAMYRHVVLRLRADGVTNAVNVLAYMGNEKWMAQSWWKDLYPGNDVVDWMGLDSYVSVEPGYYHFGGFGDLIDRQPTGGGVGWFDWAVRNHPGKPIMIAEWGMYHRVGVVTDKAAAFATVLPVLKSHPQIKAIVYFDTARDDDGDRNIAVDSTPAGKAAFRKLAADPIFNVTIGR
jgi:beta-mannanase